MYLTPLSNALHPLLGGPQSRRPRRKGPPLGVRPHPEAPQSEALDGEAAGNASGLKSYHLPPQHPRIQLEPSCPYSKETDSEGTGISS